MPFGTCRQCGLLWELHGTSCNSSLVATNGMSTDKMPTIAELSATVDAMNIQAESNDMKIIEAFLTCGLEVEPSDDIRRMVLKVPRQRYEQFKRRCLEKIQITFPPAARNRAE